MELLGFVLAFIVGVSLGLVGSGGSILTLPILAYLFLLDEKVATAYSLFIVGIAALVGGIKQSRNNNVDWRTAIIFGIPAIIGVWLVRHFLVPELPDVLFNLGDFKFTRRMGMLGLFAVLMIWAALAMLTNKKAKIRTRKVNYNYPLILIEGLITGAITGFVGAGGGFLIIPVLVILSNLEIKKVIGTSLIIIAFKSLIGFFLGDALAMTIDWNFLLIFSLITVSGIFLGVFLGKFVNEQLMKKAYGYFIIVMALFIVTMEFVI